MKCRKVVACILLVAMLLTLCACGKENSDGKKSSEEKEAVSMLTAQKWKDVNSNSELRFYENGTGICWTDTSIEWKLSGKEVTVKWRETDRDVIRILGITDRDGYTVLASEDEEYVYAKENEYDAVYDTIERPEEPKAEIQMGSGKVEYLTSAELCAIYEENGAKYISNYQLKTATIVGTVKEVNARHDSFFAGATNEYEIVLEEGWEVTVLRKFHDEVEELSAGDKVKITSDLQLPSGDKVGMHDMGMSGGKDCDWTTIEKVG